MSREFCLLDSTRQPILDDLILYHSLPMDLYPASVSGIKITILYKCMHAKSVIP